MKYKSFINDKEKIEDFKLLSKTEFLKNLTLKQYEKRKPI